MKKIFFSAAMLLICALNSQADDILYDSGVLSTNSAYVVPDWITVNSTVQTTSFKQKTGLDDTKTIAPFSTAIGITSGATSAYGLYLIRNDDNASADPSVNMSLDLSQVSGQATSVYVQFWGTGGKSIIMASGASSTTATGVSSYTAGTATLVLGPSATQTVTITPKAKDQTTASNGDTYINRVIVYGTSTPSAVSQTNADSEIIRYEYYNINGAQLKEKPSKGFYIEQGIRENGTRTSRTMGAF